MIQATQFRRCRAGLIFYLGVAPDGVYTDPVCHHTSGELLPRLFIITRVKAKSVNFSLRNLKLKLYFVAFPFSHKASFARALVYTLAGRLFSVALSLRFPLLAVNQHHCSMEPGLSSRRTLRFLPATIRLTKFNFTTIVIKSQFIL